MGFIIRNLKRSDLNDGFLNTLNSLRPTIDYDHNVANMVFDDIASNPQHVIFVAEIDEKIVGSVTIIIEPKFIHYGSLAAHVEDVTVASTHQTQGIGEKLMHKALSYAEELNCYRTTTNIIKPLVPFYERLGFYIDSVNMRYAHSISKDYDTSGKKYPNYVSMSNPSNSFSQNNPKSYADNDLNQKNEFKIQNLHGDIKFENNMNTAIQLTWFVEGLINEVDKNSELNDQQKIELKNKLGSIQKIINETKEYGKEIFPHIITTGLKEFFKIFNV